MPTDSQEMVVLEPTANDSPPLGETTLTEADWMLGVGVGVGVGEGWIIKIGVELGVGVGPPAGGGVGFGEGVGDTLGADFAADLGVGVGEADTTITGGVGVDITTGCFPKENKDTKKATIMEKILMVQLYQMQA